MKELQLAYQKPAVEVRGATLVRDARRTGRWPAHQDSRPRPLSDRQARRSPCKFILDGHRKPLSADERAGVARAILDVGHAPRPADA